MTRSTKRPRPGKNTRNWIKEVAESQSESKEDAVALYLGMVNDYYSIYRGPQPMLVPRPMAEARPSVASASSNQFEPLAPDTVLDYEDEDLTLEFQRWAPGMKPKPSKQLKKTITIRVNEDKDCKKTRRFDELGSSNWPIGKVNPFEPRRCDSHSGATSWPIAKFNPFEPRARDNHSGPWSGQIECPEKKFNPFDRRSNPFLPHD